MRIKGEVPFLTIELSPTFGFGHRTQKIELLCHATIKPSTSGHLGSFDDGDFSWHG